MADVYCDQTLVTGLADGTSWANAYQTLAAALASGARAAGDVVYVKNNGTAAVTTHFYGKSTYSTNPPIVLGCKPGTTAEPPAQSDLIAGLRTGGATLAYDDANVPTFSTTGSTTDITFRYRFGLIYGMKFVSGDDLFLPYSSQFQIDFEECHFITGNVGSGVLYLGQSTASTPQIVEMKNCKVTSDTNIWGAGRTGIAKFQDCILDITGSAMIDPGPLRMYFEGCDFSAQSGAIIANGGGDDASRIFFADCKIHASSALVSGSVIEPFRAEFVRTSSGTGKTTGGSFRALDIITNNGTITEETTAVRTGGADDGGDGAWALAFTPNVNGTRDQYTALVGPKMGIKVAGDGTAKTITVYIANSGAADYNDDDVWLEVRYPSETGVAQSDFATTQMDLLGTPSAVTDDTGSTWGTGASNHQKLSVSISPDYTGLVECVVHFAKNFASSPETLYVDPLPVVT